jgi:hypothetical protein
MLTEVSEEYAASIFRVEEYIIHNVIQGYSAKCVTKN